MFVPEANPGLSSLSGFDGNKFPPAGLCRYPPAWKIRDLVQNSQVFHMRFPTKGLILLRKKMDPRLQFHQPQPC